MLPFILKILGLWLLGSIVVAGLWALVAAMFKRRSGLRWDGSSWSTLHRYSGRPRYGDD